MSSPNDPPRSRDSTLMQLDNISDSDRHHVCAVADLAGDGLRGKDECPVCGQYVRQINNESLLLVSDWVETRGGNSRSDTAKRVANNIEKQSVGHSPWTY